jgi:glycosyltransferase involved in cell wall biosynthesis
MKLEGDKGIVTTGETLKGLKICYFGHYDSDYARNRIIKKALKKLGADVIEINSQAKNIARYGRLLSASAACKFDLMVVGFLGHTDMPLAKLVCSFKKRPVIFDAFISLYDSAVWDRQLFHPESFTAKRLYYFDKLACRLADIVLLDTDTHIRYFVDTFRLPRRKFRRVWAGADGDSMYPRPYVHDNAAFTVFFYGSFIPLHGAEYIIRAAKILARQSPDIHFTVIGSGQTLQMARELAVGLSNVQFLGRVAYDQLPGLMSEAQLCLGIFGTTAKVQRVIPNKVFDALAVGRPVISADTPAIKEALTHGENVWLCPAGDGEALADAILTLKKDNGLRERIAENGHCYFKRHFSINAIAKELRFVIGSLLCDRNKIRV